MKEKLYIGLLICSSMQLLFLDKVYGGGYETLCDEQEVNTEYSLSANDICGRVTTSYRALHSEYYKNIKGEFKRLISLEKRYDVQASELFAVLRKKIKASHEQDEIYQAGKLCEDLLKFKMSDEKKVENSCDEFESLLKDGEIALSINVLCQHYQALDKFDEGLDIHLQKAQKMVQNMGALEIERLWLGDYICGCMSSLLCCIPCLMNSCGCAENSERLSNCLDTKYAGLIVSIKALKQQVVMKKNEWSAQGIANRQQDNAWLQTSQGQRVKKDILEAFVVKA